MLKASSSNLQHQPQGERNLELLKKFRETGLIEFRNQLISENQKLVWKIAHLYLWSGEPVDDLFQEGNIGLITAIDKFNPSLGFKFSTYAVFWIKQAIQRYLAASGGLIRLPVGQQDLLRQIEQAKHSLRQNQDKEPTLEEVCKFLGLSQEKVENLLKAKASTQVIWADESLDSGFEEKMRTLWDRIADVQFREVEWQVMEKFRLEWLAKQVHKAVAKLKPAQRTVIVCLFFQDLTARELAEIMGCTYQNVYQFRDAALKRLRRILAEKLKKDKLSS